MAPRKLASKRSKKDKAAEGTSSAPEYALHGQLSEKADTYSYGIVVLEIISGRKSTDVNAVNDDSEDDYLLRQVRNFP